MDAREWVERYAAEQRRWDELFDNHLLVMQELALSAYPIINTRVEPMPQPSEVTPMPQPSEVTLRARSGGPGLTVEVDRSDLRAILRELDALREKS